MKKLISLLIILSIIASLISCAPPLKKDELVLYMDAGEDLKIANFADLHFGEEGTIYHNADEARAVAFMDYIVETEKPDFIVLGGDNMMSGGVREIDDIIEVMDRYKTPYTFVFGNHDAELYLPGYTKHDVSVYLEQSDSPYLLYKSGYIEGGGENRYGNFSISLKDRASNKLLGAFVVIDTGVYDYSLDKYQTITAGQINWYKEEIARLNTEYLGEGGKPHAVIPTITYGHIQLPEHFEAYDKALTGEGAEFVYTQKLGYDAREPIDDGESFFDAMVEMGSSHAYICGHMHNLNFHVKMDGIILGFCPQICVTKKDGGKRSTFVYTLGEDFYLVPKLINEP